MLGPSLFYSLIPCTKSFWSIQLYKEIHAKCCSVCENFSLKEVILNMWWLSCWKKLIEQKQLSHLSSLLEVLKSLFLMQFITREALNSSCNCWCGIKLHWFNFVWKWFVGRLVINNITMIYNDLQMINKLLSGKIGCKLRKSPIFCYLTIFIVSMFAEWEFAIKVRSFCVSVSSTVALLK